MEFARLDSFVLSTLWRWKSSSQLPKEMHFLYQPCAATSASGTGGPRALLLPRFYLSLHSYLSIPHGAGAPQEELTSWSLYGKCTHLERTHTGASLPHTEYSPSLSQSHFGLLLHRGSYTLVLAENPPKASDLSEQGTSLASG